MGLMALKEYMTLVLALILISNCVDGRLPPGFRDQSSARLAFSSGRQTYEDVTRPQHRFKFYEGSSAGKREAKTTETTHPADVSLDEKYIFGGGPCAQKNKMKKELEEGDVGELYCEVWIPLGTTIQWYKGNDLIRDYSPVKGHSVPACQEPPKILIKSVYYLYCSSEEDQGEYKFVIRLPNDQQFERIFSLTVKKSWISKTQGLRFPARSWPKQNWICCKDCAYRVTNFAIKAKGQRGQELVLPCNVEGTFYRYTVWAEGQLNEISEHNRKYQQSNGCLVIKDLSKKDKAFTCYVVGWDDALQRNTSVALPMEIELLDD